MSHSFPDGSQESAEASNTEADDQRSSPQWAVLGLLGAFEYSKDEA